MMGYDRASTMFSPEGRLLQVEYAKKTVKQGTATIGIVCKDGVVLVADKRIIDKLIVSDSVEKIAKIDDHIGAAASGMLSDGRILIEKAQVMAQQHRVTYDTPVDTLTIVKEVANVKQAFTQYGGARPFGVSILFAGVENNTPRLFMTDVTGIFFEYKATAIGEFELEIKEILDKDYKENLTIQDGLNLAVKALKKVLGKDFDVARIDAAYINVKDKMYKKLKQEELQKLAK
jgi:proteasome alpha subunit